MVAHPEALLGPDADRVVGGDGSPVGDVGPVRRRGVGAKARPVDRVHVGPGIALRFLPDIGGAEGGG